MDGQDFGRAAVGWTLPHGRGTFLVAFEGYKESSYDFHSTGYQDALDPNDPQPPVIPSGPFVWWNTTIQNGQLVATRTPPHWDVNIDDANGNLTPDRDEVRYTGADIT